MKACNVTLSNQPRTRLCAVMFSMLFFALAVGRLAGAGETAERWLSRIAALSPAPSTAAQRPMLEVLRQDFEQLELNRSILKTPLKIGQRQFGRGLGTHSISHVRFHSLEPLERFSALIGVDNNERTQGGQGSVVFSLWVGEQEIYRSQVLRGGQEPEKVEVALKGATVFDLRVGDAGDGPSCDHSDWAEAAVTARSGKTIRLDEVKVEAPSLIARYPFSFTCGDQPSDDLLDSWRRESRSARQGADRATTTTIWTDPKTGLRVHCEMTRFSDFPAIEWILHFENAGTTYSPIIENIQALSLSFRSPLSREIPYRLYRTNGAPANPTDFEASVVVINPHRPVTMGGGGGRSSNRDFPFFKIETGEGSAIVAVGWSGQWQARLESPDGRNLRVAAGMEKTHFRLHPGEKVRSPRMLVLFWDGDSWESNAQFRQLIYRHYAATRDGKKPLPTLFCNTAFTRGGGWLNECNAENQISLIRAYAPLGLEALLTDAGWFEGGWPAGAGNWTPRRDAYPNGMGPVAAAARASGMIYGLWFEPERVVAGTWVHRNHPEWCLRSGDRPQDTYLLDFGLREVQNYFFAIVKGFMDLPGFRFYRQDFNMDPLPYWRHHDAPGRQGITEIRYIEGLYAYWDRIAAMWPDSLREECASGGRRIDIETIMRFHIHQKTDYWFDNDVDQASIWGLSQYLPNNVIVAHLNRLDDYSFHSTLASSLCVGWIADARDFNFARAKRLADRYGEVRHFLIGLWYPLLPYSRAATDWMASQYHRADLDGGMILIFRHAQSPYRTVEISLRGLNPEATYELRRDSTSEQLKVQGRDLMDRFELTLDEKHRSDLILYRRSK